MRTLTCMVLLLLICSLGFVGAAQQSASTSVPNLVNYSGTIRDAASSGTGAARTLGVTFAIYNQAEGGAPLWSETQNVTVTATGRYSVLLGSSSSTGLPGDLFSPAEPRWLGVKVEGQTEQPRVLLVSVPYAMKAAEADRLAGHSVSEFVTTDNLQTAVQQQVQQQTNGPSQARTTTVGVSPNQNTSPYINNGTVLQTGADFNIDGTGTAATLNVTGNYNLAGTPVLGNSGTQGMFIGAGAGQNNTGSYNLFLGIAAGHNTTAADYNTFIGTDAGYFNTTGTQNFMLGATAGYHNTTGSYNMFVGSLAGYSNTTGTRNAFVGRAAGSGNTTGTGNSFFGANAGFASTADFNTFLGGFSGTATTTGNHNTFAGWQAGQFNVTGSYSLILGYNAGSAGGTASNNDVYIASPGAGNETGVIRIGDPANQTTAYMAGINGANTISGMPVFVDSTGKLGTAGGSSFSIAGTGTAGTFNAGQYQSGGGTVLYTGDPSSRSVFVGLGAGSLSSGGNENSFVGNLAGNSNTSGGGNSFFGYSAGLSNTTGGSNSFFGVQAGNSNTSGQYNAFFGSGAGFTNSTGQNNSFFGTGAGSSNSTAWNNVAVGASSGGSDNTSGGANVFVGANAGQNNTAGGGNTMVGFTAGLSNTTGSNNVFYGYGAGGYNSTGSNNVYLAAPGVGAENNTIRIGEQGTGQHQQNATYIVGISGASTSGGVPVFVDASGKLGTTGGSLGGVTSFNGRSGAVVPATNDYSFSQISGTLGSSQLSGAYSNAVTLPNTSNVFYGNGANLTGITIGSGSPYYIQNGTALQASANFNISGNGTANSFNSGTTYGIGGSSVLSIGSPTDGNLFVGVAAGPNLVVGQGQGNVFVGGNTGLADTTGGGNSFVGGGAGYSNTTGGENSFFGNGAGSANTTGYDNSYVGYLAGVKNTTGDNNSYYGAWAGFWNDTGSNNTFVGAYTGPEGTGGSYNTFLGAFAGGVNCNSGSSDVYIANVGSCSESNTLRIGSQGTGNGQQNVAYIAGIYGGAVGGGGIAVYVDSNGQLGTTVSSSRFKEQIRDMGDSTDALMKLRPVTFLYKPEYDKGPRTLQYGLIAEEVAEVYPELVAFGEDGKPYTVKYQYLTTMLLNEMQKQYHRAEAQAEVIKAQEQNMKTQQQEIERLKAQLKLQYATFEDRLSRLESMVETQMRTATRKAPQATMAADGGLQ